jgi:hypothetical protein
MGTSADIQIKANDKIGFFYIGSDGYPTGAGRALAIYVRELRKKGINLSHENNQNFLDDFCNDFSQVTGVSIHLDDEYPGEHAEFTYGLDLDNDMAIMLSHGVMMFRGPITEWIQVCNRITFNAPPILFNTSTSGE